MSAPTTVLPLPQACLNCGQLFAAPPPRCCPACGQETTLRAPKLGEFLQQLGGAYFSTEGALWRTLKLLLTQPGELSAHYLAGRRKHYVLPLRLLLSVSVLMLLVMRVVGSIEAAAMDDPEVTMALPERPRSIELNLGLGYAGLEDGQFYCESQPPWLCSRIERKLNVDTRSMVLQMQKVMLYLAHAVVVNLEVTLVAAAVTLAALLL